jgi:hypothetical protein
MTEVNYAKIHPLEKNAVKNTLKVSSLLIFLIVAVCLAALPGYHKSDSINLSFAVYPVFLLFCFWRFNKGDWISSNLFYLSSLIVISLATSSLLSSKVPLEEYLIICKPFFLALLLNFSLRTEIAEKVWRLRFAIFRAVILFAFFKYFVSVVWIGYDRPFLLHENNFEIPLFILMYAWLHDQVKLNFDFIALTSVILLSGSFSGYATYIFFVFIYSRKNIKKIPALILIVSLVIFGSFFAGDNAVVADRVSNIALEERVIWVVDLHAAKEEKGQSIWALLSAPTALPESFCASLHSYNKTEGAAENECYTRALHGNMVRFLVDFGVLPTLFFIASFFYFLYKKLGFRLSCLIIGVGILNGLSVSGFGNIFFLAGVVLLLIPRPHDMIIPVRNHI